MKTIHLIVKNPNVKILGCNFRGQLIDTGDYLGIITIDESVYDIDYELENDDNVVSFANEKLF